MKNLAQTIISQYGASPNLQTLLEAINQWLSLDAAFENFFNTVWNIETASGYGLDVLGRIVGVPRTISAPPAPTFGFYEAGDRANFGMNGPFWEAQPSIPVTTYTLSDDAYRSLILAKAAYNITDGSIPSINAILMNLFGSTGNCYVVDNGNMTITYTFTGQLTPVQMAIAQSGILPKPTGVSANFNFLGNQ